MKSLPPFSLALLIAIALLQPATAQEGERKGRQLLEGILKTIIESNRDPGSDPRSPAPAGQLNLNAFHADFNQFRQEIDALASAAGSSSGNQNVRNLLPAIAQIQNRAKFGSAYLARESRAQAYLDFYVPLDEQWRDLSDQIHNQRNASSSVRNITSRIDAYADRLLIDLGMQPKGATSVPGQQGFQGGSDALILVGLLQQDVEGLFDKISLNEILYLTERNQERLLDSAHDLASACVSLEDQLKNNARDDVLITTHRKLAQEWSSFHDILHSGQDMGLEAQCDRVGSYVEELDRLLAQSGRHGHGSSGYSSNPDHRQTLALATQLEVLAGDLYEIIENDSRYFRNQSLRNNMLKDSSEFVNASQNLRRFMMNPALDRNGRLDERKCSQTWEVVKANWSRVSNAINQLGSQVRNADRYFPYMYRTQDDIQEIMSDLDKHL